MPQESLRIEDQPGRQPEKRILRLNGPLVGAYVTRQHGARSLALVGVSERIHNALKVTRVEQFLISSILSARRNRHPPA
jgi:hypothetical protein